MNSYNKFSHRLYLKFSKLKSNLNYNISKINMTKILFVIISLIISFTTFKLGNSISKLYLDSNSSETLVHFINVGQGDAILINNPSFNILIDSGSNNYSDELISYLKSFKINDITYLIATHPHEDHIGSMDDIIKTFNIKNIIAPKVTTDDVDFNNFLKALVEKNLQITLIENNSTINLSNNNSIKFLWSGYITSDNLNNNSIVFKYINNNISFLFTGDMEKEIESKLLYLNSDLLSSNVLKVPHHGSNSSSSIEFLNQINPNISIISCGLGNDYGHPHKNTLANLNKIDSSIYRTDISGNIIIKTDGHKLWINTQYKD